MKMMISIANTGGKAESTSSQCEEQIVNPSRNYLGSTPMRGLRHTPVVAAEKTMTHAHAASIAFAATFKAFLAVIGHGHAPTEAAEQAATSLELQLPERIAATLKVVAACWARKAWT